LKVIMPAADNSKPFSLREWQAELSIARLLRASIRLQRALDQRFAQFGITAQEAAVLLNCAELGETSPGRLAQALSRDPAKITRFVSRLEANGFLARRIHPHDHRSAIIKTTGKGRRLCPHLKAAFNEVRHHLFDGLPSSDLDRLETLLAQLDLNAEKLWRTKKGGLTKAMDWR
jgi:DNA-binding MarR family transcriptional regulator